MKADIKARWISDLRSGKYVQGKAALEQVESDGTHKFCCLGVLCRQAVAAGAIPEPELMGSTYYYLDDVEDDNGDVTGQAFTDCSTLPRLVREWAGVPGGGDIKLGPDVFPPDYEHYNTAINANDSLGMTFDQIADLAEQYVPGE
jgi:hypothetical protein